MLVKQKQLEMIEIQTGKLRLVFCITLIALRFLGLSYSIR